MGIIRTMIDRSWMTALEMQFAALRCINSGSFQETNPRSQGRTYALLKSGLQTADCFSWSEEMWIAVSRASRTLPGDCRLPHVSLPSRSAWMYFGQEHDPFDALFYTPIQDTETMLIGLFRTDGNDIVPYLTFVWGYDESLDELRSGSRRTLNVEQLEASHYAARFLICASAWLQQRIVTFSSGHIERHRRKQLAREYNTPVASDVKVIQLRRIESQPNEGPKDGEFVDWSCRWIVGGHWRNQLYAHDERKLIYIMPFVKGPADKPLKVPTHTVYQVNR